MSVVKRFSVVIVKRRLETNLPSTYLQNWLKKWQVKTEEYEDLREACIAFEHRFRVHLMIEVQYWDDLPNSKESDN